MKSIQFFHLHCKANSVLLRKVFCLKSEIFRSLWPLTSLGRTVRIIWDGLNKRISSVALFFIKIVVRWSLHKIRSAMEFCLNTLLTRLTLHFWLNSAAGTSGAVVFSLWTYFALQSECSLEEYNEEYKEGLLQNASKSYSLLYFDCSEKVQKKFFFWKLQMVNFQPEATFIQF